MKSRWDSAAAPAGDVLTRRAYSSRLLGADRALVLHGGGNTSAKTPHTDRFGRPGTLLWVKASGFDLATMGVEGFTALDLDAVVRLAQLASLSDTEMVNELLRARLDASAATPSIEAIAHGLIPYTFVDHTHADAVVTISNLPDGGRRLRDVFGDRVLVLPYVKPGFVLARQLAGVVDRLGEVDGVILEHHGLFTYADDARHSYERTIALVDAAEQYLRETFGEPVTAPDVTVDPLRVARSRRLASDLAGRAVVSLPAAAIAPGAVHAVARLVVNGPLTPEHVIHNKPFPAVVGDDLDGAFAQFATRYRAYVARAPDADLVMLPPHPHWAMFSDGSVRSYGLTLARARVSADIAATTLAAMGPAVAAGGWAGLSEAELRDLEYWELEQAKLRRQPPPRPLTGRIALVTGAASGIGRACAEALAASGAVVVGLDIDPAVVDRSGPAVDGRVVDATDDAAVKAACAAVVSDYGGLDVVVSTIGIFRSGATVEELDDETWSKSLAVNLTAHRSLARHAIGYLRHGVEPSIVFIGSRNATAPGPGAAAYSVSKAGLTQLMRVLALELAPEGVRVNAVHPDAVFDTALWTEEVLATSARRYGVTVEEYRTRNLLAVEVTAADVASAVTALVDGTFAKTTGAQIPVDGGNNRVI